jgi:hypothetical protein
MNDASIRLRLKTLSGPSLLGFEAIRFMILTRRPNRQSCKLVRAMTSDKQHDI